MSGCGPTQHSDRMNKADDGTMVVPSEYLEVVINKQ